MPFIKKLKPVFYFASLIYLLSILNSANTAHADLPDTGQAKCYNNTGEIPCPESGQPFYGQDGSYQGPQPAYQVSADGLVVTDLNTGLVWQRADDGIFRRWDFSSAYCESLVLGGHSDWRLPSRQELLTIVDYGRFNPAINPAFNCQSHIYCSRSTYAENPTFAFWAVIFTTGDSPAFTQLDGCYVRCVRGGP